MMIDAWWFENKQKEEDILQPEWFTPRTHCGIYAEFKKIKFPFYLNVEMFCSKEKIYSRTIKIDEKQNSQQYDLMVKNNSVIIKIFSENIGVLPESIHVLIRMNDRVYKRQIKCKYSVIQGLTTDFNNNPFPAAVVFMRKAFGGNCPCIGCWSDKDGKYSVTVPNGLYCAFYVEDNSYKESTLENWSWRMFVDRDEVHDFKIGTGEVYGLSVWEDNGGRDILFIYFRPMILPQIRMQKYKIELNGVDREVIDIQPDLEKNDLRIYIDNEKVELLSLQKIYETGIYKEGDYTLIGYIVQVKKPVMATGKHMLIVEYETFGKYKSQSQGRTQFFVDTLL